MYKIEISNSANVVKLNKINIEKIDGAAKLAINGRIYYNSSRNQTVIANTYTNEVLPPENTALLNSWNNYAYTPTRGEPLIFYADCTHRNERANGGWYMMCNYLATINNLDTPVTKTADKTMKITYILQEEGG